MRYGAIISVFCLLLSSFRLDAQDCVIKNKMRPDGSILYYMDPVLFFNTTENKIYGGVVTDKELYFVSVYPRPFPPKSQSKKLDHDLMMTLSNGKEFKLDHYDSQYLSDTSLVILYLIPKKEMQEFKTNDIHTLKIDLGSDKGAETFQLRLHKSALKDQLACLAESKN